MKGIIGTITLLLGLFAVLPTHAAPVDDCLTVRSNQVQAFNDRNWDKLVSTYTTDVHFFGSAANEIIIGADALRSFYLARPTDVKLRLGEHSAVQVASNVVICSGYQVLIVGNRESVLRVTFVLVNNNGNWLVAQTHASQLPFVIAQQLGTAAEAKAMFDRAVAALNANEAAALAAFNDKGNKDYHHRDLYVFCYRMSDGIVTAHVNEAIMGKDTRTIKVGDDPLGQRIYDTIKNAPERAVSTLAYKFPKPGTTELAPKESYVTRIGNEGCGVGHYK